MEVKAVPGAPQTRVSMPYMEPEEDHQEIKTGAR